MTYQQLEAFLDEVNIPINVFCKETGISRQIITNAKSRGGHFSAATENKMKDFFERNGLLEIKNHITGEENRFDISTVAYRFAKEFDNLNDEHKRMIIEMLAFFKSQKQD